MTVWSVWRSQYEAARRERRLMVPADGCYEATGVSMEEARRVQAKIEAGGLQLAYIEADS